MSAIPRSTVGAETTHTPKNTGVLCQRTPAFDVDISNEEAAEAVEALAREHFEELGRMPLRIGLPPKRLIPFHLSGSAFKKIAVSLAAPNSKKGDKPDKLELLADGQQFVAFGIHPDTKKPYTWHGGDPSTVKLAELPPLTEAQAQQLVDDATALLIDGFGYRRVTAERGNGRARTHAHDDDLNSIALRNLDPWVPKFFGGKAERFSNGWRVSSKALTRDLQEDLSLTPDGIVDFGIHDQGDEREGRRTPLEVCIEYGGMSFAEADRFLRECLGIKGDAIEPIDLWANFDPPALPTGLLPDVIERFATTQGETMGADPAGLAMSALAVCGAAIPDSVELQVKQHDSWYESARVWVALIGSPSTKKSPIIRQTAGPLKKLDASFCREYADAARRFDALSKEEKKTHEPPGQKRLVLEDTTIEAAGEILKASPDGVLCLQDELSGWFGAMDKYSSGRGANKDRAFYLSSFNGGEHTVNRIGRGAIFIPNLSISVLGGIQPEVIRTVAADTVDDGLLQRLLPIVLQEASEGKDEPLKFDVAKYAELVENLRMLKPIRLRFDQSARDLRQQLERRHLELMRCCEAINRKMSAHIGKYDGLFARLCVVWHCIENIEARSQFPEIVKFATAQRVANFMKRFLLPHALAFYSGLLGLGDDHDRLTAVAGYILARELDEVTNRHVQRGDQTMRKLTKRDAETVFEQLEALGWVTRQPGPRLSSPPRWLVNPEVHRRFEARAGREAERRQRARETLVELLGSRQ